MQPELSVIIPAYNRAETLKKVLASLLDQTLELRRYEIIVVNDGSADNTKDIVEGFRRSHPNIYYFEQHNRGPAAARNVGIRHALGACVFFTGDDIIASRGLLKAHLDCLQQNPECAILGYTQWDPGIPVSPFMEYIMRHGHQFDYDGLRDGQEVAWGMFYTSNISLARSWLRNDVFDENMPYPIWEDSELGYRLTKKGLRIVFNKQAAAFHSHIITEQGFFNKLRQSGIVRTHFYSRHPELTTRLFRLGRTKPALIAVSLLRLMAPVLWFLRLRVWYWEINLNYYTVLGIHQGCAKDICKKA